MQASHRVLYLRSSSGFHGPEKQIVLLAQGVRDAGFDPGILLLYRQDKTMPAIHPLVKVAKERGVPAHQLADRNRFSLRTIWQIAKTLTEGEFGLLHAHGYKANILGLLAARLTGVPIIGTVRLHTETTTPLKLYKRLDLLALRLCDHVVTVSEDLRREALSAGLAPDKVTTIWNGIDVVSFAAQAVCGTTIREELDLGPDERVVTAIGRLTSQKGYSYLLQSVPLVLQALPETRFLIAGDGPLRSKLEREAYSLGIGSSVYFLGYRTDVAPLIALSDLIVMPSLREGLPNVILEALALAKPVIATAVGGIPEIITHQVSGILIPPRDPVRLAESILQVLTVLALARGLGERGRQEVTERFTVAAMVDRTVTLYRQVLHPGRV
jgi:glycosyltransferase involved in cell wall biosynthesis